ncbi:MAG TPA: hypothetical protein VL989_03315 [Candidatus Sulfotelmatobacter sp.]|nr:hypothetical protein [Candidatus Sulfotelmatobacter sp.]
MKALTLLKSRSVQLLLALIIADFIFFSNTSAYQSSPQVIIVGFSLLIISVYAFIYGVFKLLGLYGIKIKESHKLSIAATVFTSAVIALQSIGELTLKDVLVLAPLTVIGYFYASYNKKVSRQVD